jgi:hypothetical protein
MKIFAIHRLIAPPRRLAQDNAAHNRNDPIQGTTPMKTCAAVIRKAGNDAYDLEDSMHCVVVC